MAGWHPAAGSGGNPFHALQVTMNRLGQRLRLVETRPPAGLLTPLRIDTPPPATSSTDPVGLWRFPATPPGTSTLIGVVADVTGTATGELLVLDEQGGVLEELTVPYAGDVGPYPCTSGVLTVSARRLDGTGTVTVDVTGCRYGPVLADDQVSESEQELDAPDTPNVTVTS